MSEINELLGEQIKDYHHFKLGRILEATIQRTTVEQLGLRDLGQLKDRFEGQSFLDNNIMKIGSYLACLEFFDLPKPNINVEFINSFKPIIKYNNETFVVVAIKMDSFPILNFTEFKAPRIFVLSKGQGTFCVLGKASIELLNNQNNFITIDETKGRFKSLNLLERNSKP